MSIEGRILELFDTDRLMPKLEKDFRMQQNPEKITYITPQGNFTITRQISDQKTIAITLLKPLPIIPLTYYNPDCNHVHSMTHLRFEQFDATAQFCRSTMNAEFDPDFKDASLQKRINDFVHSKNLECSQGVTSLPPMDESFWGFKDAGGKLHRFKQHTV